MRESFTNELFIKARKKHIPLYATIELTYRCNLRCIHCYLSEYIKNPPPDELRKEEIFGIIDQLADAGTLEITFTGGEVFVRKDFFEIANYARKKNMAVGIISNGTLIDEEIVKKMKEIYFSQIFISLYGARPEIHEKVTEIPGSFSKTTEAVKLLKENGLKVNIKTPVMKENVNGIPELDDWASKIGININPNPLLSPTVFGSKKPLNYRLDDEELRRFIEWELKKGKKVLGLTRTCNAGIISFSISPYGKVYPCVMLRLEAGDLRKEDFKKIWDDSPIFKWIRGLEMKDFKECYECPFLEICVRCPGQSLEEEGDMLVANRESCRISKMRAKIKKE